LQSTRTTEFINNYYALSEEPLNLRRVGQAWFRKTYEHLASRRHATGLILGGTPWLGTLLTRRMPQVFMVDISQGMLDTARAEVDGSSKAGDGHIDYVAANWLAMPEHITDIDCVVGDNCLTFLQYPDGCRCLFDNVAAALAPHADVMLRIMSIPRTHRPLSLDGIVSKYLQQPSFTFTQVRAELLLSYWQPDIMAIPTERVVQVFDENEHRFRPLLAGRPVQNDLFAIRKFRNSGYMMYAPRFEDIMGIMEEYFAIADISYGPYPLAEYFPLIRARRRER
jgi:hypothetical protein